MKEQEKTKEQAEFGDFQTPPELAAKVCSLLLSEGLKPATIIEPTCGVGNLLQAALDCFPNSRHAIGLDISSEYIRMAALAIEAGSPQQTVRFVQGSFFQTDWSAILKDLPDPLLVIGNPPWVTNAHVSVLGGANLPQKSNFQRHGGMDAMTGKSNFDISESMLLSILRWFDRRNGTLSLLCKTNVARKILVYAWRNGMKICDLSMRRIDAAQYFKASVDACMLTCTFDTNRHDTLCPVFNNIDDEQASQVLAYRRGQLIADLALYERWKHLEGKPLRKWRSGIKHDCAKVMELEQNGSGFRNGLGETVDIEMEYIFPMLKSSDIANGSGLNPRRWMIVTQSSIGEETCQIKSTAPKTWKYLQSHAQMMGNRGSSIYKNRPAFSIFGVGSYSFAPWKVAISGLYKTLQFTVVGNLSGKPIMLDDTVNFIPCYSASEARYIADILNSLPAKEFFHSIAFWDAKRPVTVELLHRLDLIALAREMGTTREMTDYLSLREATDPQQMALQL
ncbi:MAG: SAM-dependent DNA methyltransferase [Armatimonadota bacterium]|nr:SAM-dependent DNA methyltransferase [Armatimonadota bacterium]